MVRGLIESRKKDAPVVTLEDSDIIFAIAIKNMGDCDGCASLVSQCVVVGCASRPRYLADCLARSVIENIKQMAGGNADLEQTLLGDFAQKVGEIVLAELMPCKGGDC